MKLHKFETNAVRIKAKKSPYKEHCTPVFETSAYVFDSAEEAKQVFAEEKEGYIYSRFNNPSSDEFIEKLCALENAEAGIATASGMAAIFLTIAGKLSAGDHIIVSKHLFGTTHLLVEQVLPKWGISHSYVNLNNHKEIEDSVLPTTKMIFCETPSNPGLEIFDIAQLAKFTAKNNLYLAVDNSFCSPYLQNPISLGADFVVHSSTKFIDGQGRTLGGAVLGRKDFMKDIVTLSRITGPNMSAHTAWLLSKSLETLAARMDRHCKNALTLAKYLETNKEINEVRYPFLSSDKSYKTAKKQMSGGGAMLSIDLKGGMKRTMKFINELDLFSIASNLGDTRSIITHPASTTHSKLTKEAREEAGITDSMVRVSIGLENIDDLIEDVENALKKSKV